VLEQPIKTTDPLGRTTTRTFDAAGNLQTKTDPSGRTTTYGYDKADRVKKVSYSAEPEKDTTFGYDEDGDVTSMVDATGESRLVYDELGRLIHSENGAGETVSWEYDLADEPVGLIYPDHKSIGRTYDEDGRLESVTDWLGDDISFAYNPDSELTGTTFPAGTGDTDEYAYDHAGRMTGVTMKKGSETLASLAYGRDPAGQLESVISHGLPGEEEEDFAYDEEERLVKAGAGEFAYDGANNVVKAPGTTNGFDKASEIESATGASFTFDKEGERTKETPSSGAATTYKYDQAGDLTSVGRPEKGEVPAIAESFTYNGTGQMTSRAVGLSTQQLVWDPAESGLLLADGTDSFIYGPGGLPIEQISSEEAPTYIHHDQLGSTRLLTDSSGKATATFTYGPYGGPTGHTGTATSALGYAGQYTLGQSGLQFLQARFYDPATAQFLTVDPAGGITGQPYGYADGDPLNYDDPSGDWATPVFGDACLDPEVTAGCAIAGAGAAAVAIIEGHGSVEAVLNEVFGGSGSGSEAEDAEIEALARDDERHFSEEACRIANGHAFGKHGEEFGAETPDELAEIIDDTIENPTHSAELEEDRSAYYDEKSNTLVIVDPNSPDGGTVYKPYDGIKGFDKLK
jgi:RHS repeat-associated protein